MVRPDQNDELRKKIEFQELTTRIMEYAEIAEELRQMEDQLLNVSQNLGYADIASLEEALLAHEPDAAQLDTDSSERST